MVEVHVVLHDGKGAKFGIEKVNGGQNICNRDASVGMGRILKNKLSLLRVKISLQQTCNLVKAILNVLQ